MTGGKLPANGHASNGKAYATGPEVPPANGSNGSAKAHGAEELRRAGLGELLFLLPSVASREAVVEAVLQDREACRAPPGELHFPGHSSLMSRLKALALLVLVAFSLPVSLALAVTAVVRDYLRLQRSGRTAQFWHRVQSPILRTSWRGTAVVSGAKSTKGLHVCRQLHRAGWRVILVDTHKNWASGSRLSFCVAGFRTTPIPNKDPVGYLKALREIVTSEHARLFVPVSIAQFSVYEALAAELVEPLGCACCTLDAEAVAVLNDKNQFSAVCERMGMRVPHSFAITSRMRLLEINERPEQFSNQRFLLKSIHYAATHRADMFTLPCASKVLERYTRALDISPAAPWQLQQLLSGREFSCYTVAHRGRVVAHADTEARLSNLYYRHIGVPQIFEWVTDFCQRTKASGQLCFDFMLNAADGQLYAFECNPRTSTVLLEYHDHPAFADALYNPEAVLASGAAPITPLPRSAPVYWLWNEVADLLFSALPRALLSWQLFSAAPAAVDATFARLRGGVDAVLDAEDPLPFLALHYGQVPLLLVRAIRNGNPWIKVDLCTGKLVELGGD